MTSMTGFAFRQELCGDMQISVSIRSLNSRFLDISVSLPPELSRFEKDFRAAISSSLSRGKVDAAVCLEAQKSVSPPKFDADLAKSFANIARQTSQAIFGAADIEPSILRWVLSQDGVICARNAAAVDFNDAMSVFKAALADLVAERRAEGERLEKSLRELLSRLQSALSAFEKFEPDMKSLLEDRFKEAVTRIAGDFSLDAARMSQEIAAQLVKYTINEEIVRFKSHLDAMQKEFDDNPSPGKKIDFLCQEINREVNTIGSKNISPALSEIVVDAKDALEKIREQSRNIE